MATSGNFSTTNKYIVYWMEANVQSQSIEGNSSSVNVKVWVKRTNSGYTTYGSGTCYCTINGSQYSASITSGQKITNSPIVLFDRTVAVGHNEDGGKTLGISASVSHSQFSSGTNGWNYGLPTIPRASRLGMISNFTIDGNEGVGAGFNVPVTKYASVFRNTLWMYVNENMIGTREWFNGGVVTFTAAELSFIYSKMPDNTGSFRFWLVTYNNNAATAIIGQDTKTVTGTISPTGRAPTFDAASVSYKDTNTTTVAITGNDQKIIQGYNTVEITLSAKAVPNKGAALGTNAYKFAVGTDSQYASHSEDLPIKRTFHSVTGSLATVAAVDSRGNNTSVDKALSIVVYAEPTMVLEAQRTNPTMTGENMKVKVTGTYTNWSGLSQSNAIQSLKYRTRQYPNGAWSGYATLTTTQGQGTFSYENTIPGTYAGANRYEVEVVATDRLASTTVNAVIDSILPTLDIDAGNRRVGVGKLANSSLSKGSIDVSAQYAINGVPIKDHIVEQGTSGIWTYRKWSSGVSECWGVYAYRATMLGANEYFATTIHLSFPTSVFSSKPTLNGTVVGLRDWHHWLTNISYTDNEIIAFGFFAPYNAANGISCGGDMALHATGRWK